MGGVLAGLPVKNIPGDDGGTREPVPSSRGALEARRRRAALRLISTTPVPA